MNSWFRLTGAEKGGLIQKIDDLKESIEQASETLEKGQQNLETIDGMYSKKVKFLKWHIFNLKIFKTQNHKIIYVTTIVSATLAIQHDSHNYTHGIVDDLLDLNKEIASSLGLDSTIVTKPTGEKVFLTYRRVRLLK